MTRRWLALDPLDAVTFRDGRPFEASRSSFAETVTFPRPYTFAGAAEAALGGPPDAVGGPLLLMSGLLLFPVPRDVVRNEETRRDERLQLGKPEAQTDPHATYLAKGEGDYETGWVDAAALSLYLDDPRYVPNRIKGAELVREVRVGLRREGRAAQEGYLYSNQYLRFQEGCSMEYAGWFEGGPAELRREVVPFGGERRVASARVVEDLSMPALPSGLGAQLLVYLATPAVFSGGSRFPTPQYAKGREVAVHTRASVVEGPVAVSGWSKGRVRHLDWAVGAGSVYFIEFDDPADAESWARNQHGRCLTQHKKRQRTAGFGLSFIGRWKHP
jgi:CRISPR type III-B/RAMP module-associated protein Cmr3